MALGMLGKKIGMTQVADGERTRVAVTVLEVGPCVVMQKKTAERDGYSALKMAYGERKAKNLSKALRTDFEKRKITAKKMIREFRIPSEEIGTFEEGKTITVDQVFKAGQLVDIVGKTKGRGFTGVVKKWGMKGNRRSHGTHEFFRHGGSIGTRTWPGNVHRGKKMGGHYGDERVTTPNLRIIQVLPEKNCLVVAGSVPGAVNGLLEIRPSATRKIVAKA